MDTGFWVAVLSSIVASALFSGFAAFFGARVSLNRYYQERLWDRKVEAYSQIVEDLHKLYVYPSTASDEMLEPNSEKWRKLEDEYTQVRKNLVKYIHLGGFVISTDIAETLNSFNMGWYQLRVKNNSSGEFKQAELTNKCIEKIKRLAKEDLQISKPKPSWKPLYFRGSQD